MFQEYSDMVTIDEVCEMLRIGRSKAYELLRCGRITGFKDGRLWMIPKNSVIEYVESRKNRKGSA